jgi:hypothetical protein
MAGRGRLGIGLTGVELDCLTFAKKTARPPLGRPGCSFCLLGSAARHKVSVPGPTEAGGGVPLDTRRWSTGITTPLAYMTIVQQTTSFRNRVQAACRLPARGCRSGRFARRAACRTTRWLHYKLVSTKTGKRKPGEFSQNLGHGQPVGAASRECHSTEKVRDCQLSEPTR